MQDVRIDEEGEFHCWNCGGKNFSHKRTARSKMLVGVGALATHKKLKCQVCGEYNQTGNAKPYIPPGGEAVWQFGAFQWRCVAHGKAICNPCRRLAVPPSKGKRGQTFPPGSVVLSPAEHGENAADEHASDVGVGPLDDSGSEPIDESPVEVTSPIVAPPSTLSVADELAKLMQLRDVGGLTEEEFAAQKAKLLNT